LSKRKVRTEERRRATPEINLLGPDPGSGRFAKARRGCSLPFFGLFALLLTFLLQRGF